MTTPAALATTQPTSATAQSRATLSQNFETFLTLLTAQLQNQDPLSPVDSNQFTQQLVQYSQVEQQIQTNETLKGLVDQQRTNSAAAAVGYLGRSAEIAGAAATLTKDGAQWSYQLAAGALSTRLAVLDGSGRTVFETAGNTAAGDHAFAWDGATAQGARAPAGTYRLQVTSIDGKGEAISTTIAQRVRITGVDFASNTPRISTTQGDFDLAAVRRVFE